MQTFYHISLDFDNEITIFTPKKYWGLYQEDNNINRICVADTIKGCLFSSPLYNHIQKCEDPYKILNYMRLNKKTNKVGIIVKVYEFEIDINERENFITNKEIMNKNLVLDAFLSGEAQIIKEMKPNKSYLIMITNSEEEYIECGTPWELIKECPLKKVDYEVINNLEQLEEMSTHNQSLFMNK